MPLHTEKPHKPIRGYNKAVGWLLIASADRIRLSVHAIRLSADILIASADTIRIFLPFFIRLFVSGLR